MLEAAVYIFFCFVVAIIGKSRSIGFAGGLFWSFFTTPVIGLVITLLSKNLVEEQRKEKEEEYKKELLFTQKKQQESLSRMANTPSGSTANAPSGSIVEEIEKLGAMKDKGLLTDEEFSKAKEKLLKAE